MKSRIYTFDGLRGICAILVAFSHSLKFINISPLQNIEDITLWHFHGFQAIATKILLSLFNATGAVFIFFLLSSYVLASSLERMSEYNTSLFLFYIKRILRLMPAYIVSILAIALIIYFLPRHSMVSFSSFFSSFYTFRLTIIETFLNLLLIHTSFNPISWTLQVEILGSLFLPLFYFFCFKTTTNKSSIFFLLLIALAGIFRGENPLHYLYIFYLGLLLRKAKFLFIQKRKNIQVLLWIIALSLFTLPRGIVLPSSTIISQLAEVAGSWLVTGLILYADKTIINTFLSSSLPQFYGKISYSFYLLNFIITFILITYISSKIPGHFLLQYSLYINCLVAISSISITTIVAMCSYKFIELPFIRMSSQITHKISYFSREW